MENSVSFNLGLIAIVLFSLLIFQYSNHDSKFKFVIPVTENGPKGDLRPIVAIGITKDGSVYYLMQEKVVKVWVRQKTEFRN